MQRTITSIRITVQLINEVTDAHLWAETYGRENKLAPMPINGPLRLPATDVTLFLGGAGLVSTIDDYMRFAEMLRNGGEFNGARILSPKTIQYMTQNHLSATVHAVGSGESPTATGRQGSGFGLGFGIVTSPAETGVISSAGEYSWGGAPAPSFGLIPRRTW